MKRSIWVAVCAIAIASLAATYYYTRDVEAEAPAFTTAAVSRGDVIWTVDATGTLESVTTVQVGSQISGTISALHAEAPTAEATDWRQIAALYNTLAALTPSMVIEVNRAVAVAMASA